MALIECPECKREVSDQAPQCVHCGYPFKPVSTVEAPQQWETCQIEWTSTSKFLGLPAGKYYFWASATSPLFGTYSAGESARFIHTAGTRLLQSFDRDPNPHGTDDNAMRALTELVNKLIEDEWEPAGHGHAWWQHQFRRRDTDELHPSIDLVLYTDRNRTNTVRQLPVGITVKVLAAGQGWASVQTPEGETGYVFMNDSREVQKSEHEQTTPFGDLGSVLRDRASKLWTEINKPRNRRTR